jgi:hypothetical protein
MRILGCALLVATVLLLAGCGAGDPSTPSDVSPASAKAYLEFALDTSGRPLSELRGLVERAPGGPALLAELELGRSFPILGRQTSYERVQPWAGERAGIFLTTLGDEDEDEDEDEVGTGAFAVEVEDRDAARDFVQRLAEGTEAREAAGTEYRVTPDRDAAALAGDLLVFGDEDAVRDTLEVVGGDGESLADDEDYRTAVTDADDGLALLYVPPAQVLLAGADAETFNGLPPEQFAALLTALGVDTREPVVASLRTSPDALILDQSFVASADVAVDTRGGEPPLEGVPADGAVLAVAPEFGAAVGRLLPAFLRIGLASEGRLDETSALIDQLEQQGLSLEDPPIAGAAAFLDLADGAPQAALVSEVTDDRAATVLAQVISGGIASQTGLTPRTLDAELPGQPEGVVFDGGGLPAPITVALTSQRFVVAFGSDALRTALRDGDPTATRERLEEARRALGGDFTPLIALDAEPVAALLGPGAIADPSARELLAATRLNVGVRRTGERIVVRTVLSLR